MPGEGKEPKLNLSCLSNLFITRFIFRVLSYNELFLDIVFEKKSSMLGVLVSNKCVRFYKYENQSLKSKGSYHSGDGEEFVSISFIPTSDSSFTKFVVFDHEGKRLFFTISDPLLDDQVTLRYFREKPNDSKITKIQAGIFFLNFSIYVYDNSFTISKPSSIENEFANEEFASFEFPGNFLNISQSGRKMDYDRLSTFNSEFMCQHFIKSPDIFFFIDRGLIKFQIKFPVDYLNDLLKTSGGDYTPVVKKWVLNYKRNNESTASIILSAAKFHGNQRQWPLFILVQISKIFFKTNSSTDLYLPDVYVGFVNRFSRLISHIWFSVIFITKKRKRNQKEKFVLSENFIIGEQLIEDAIEIMNILKEYNDLRRTFAETDQDDYSHKTNLLLKFSTFLEIQTNIILFFSLIQSEKTLFIDSCFKRLDQPNQSELLNSYYGQTKNLLDILRKLALNIFLDESGKSREQLLLSKITSKCPLIIQLEDILS